jgi:hypothetical protein
MPWSMALRLALAAALLLLLPSCGGDGSPARELRLLAPADLVEGVPDFERATGCRVDIRAYDPGEDLETIARRRDVDVVATPTPPGTQPHDSVELVRITLDQGLEITVPKELAPAFDGPAEPAGRRSTRWTIREDGENPECARRWLAYATSQ